MKTDTKALLALGTLLSVSAIWWASAPKTPAAPPPSLATAFSIAPAPAVLSAPPVESAPSPALIASHGPVDAAPAEVTAHPLGKRFSPDDRVRASVGRWRSDAGFTVDVDPPKDLDDDHPPYRLVVRGQGLPRSGYGCEFAVFEKNAPVVGATFFQGWCKKGEKAFVILSQDDLGRLSVVVLSDHKVRVRADLLSRVEP